MAVCSLLAILIAGGHLSLAAKHFLLILVKISSHRPGVVFTKILKQILCFKSKNYCIHRSVSTEAADTMDLARVRRRRHHSVVRDFTVTALQPTVFYLELLYLQVSLRKSCLGIFLASFWKTRWPPQQFFDFFSYFFLILLLWLCYRHSFQLFRRN